MFPEKFLSHGDKNACRVLPIAFTLTAWVGKQDSKQPAAWEEFYEERD